MTISIYLIPLYYVVVVVDVKLLNINRIKIKLDIHIIFTSQFKTKINLPKDLQLQTVQNIC